MRRLLYVGDFGRTGFGTVASGLIQHLVKDWQVLHLAINYNDLEPAGTPWPTVPAGFFYPQSNGYYEAADPYGYTKINAYVDHFDPDVIFINNDFPVAIKYLGEKEPNKVAKHRSKKVLYAPADSYPFPALFAKIARQFDKTIAYSYWQKDMMCVTDPAATETPVLYHGVDTTKYFPIPKREAKRELRNVFLNYNKGANVPNFEDTFIVYFVGTNQWRKDIPALFRAYAHFRESHPQAKMFLIPHTNAVPMGPGSGGWSLTNLRDLVGLRDAIIMHYANIFTEEEMNIFYNAADVLAFPTRGEGFGLPSFEAMATKTPVIATRFGPQYEIHADNRGYFIEVEDYEPGNISAYTYFAKPSWRSLAEQLEYVYTNPDEADEVAERAYKWVINHTWERKASELSKILDEVCQSVSSNPFQSKPSKKRRRKT